MTTKNFVHVACGSYDRHMVPILLLHISLTLPAMGLTADARRTAIAEVAAIWSIHGVLVGADSGEPPAHDAVIIRVAVERRPTSLGPPSGGPLASLRFDDTGVPVPVITLYLAALVEMIARANTPGSGGDGAPALLRERAVGRAVGRVLAHELGHFLLRSRWHAESGLMRSIQTTTDLIGPERERFALSAADAARFAIVEAARVETMECTGAGM